MKNRLNPYRVPVKFKVVSTEPILSFTLKDTEVKILAETPEIPYCTRVFASDTAIGYFVHAACIIRHAGKKEGILELINHKKTVVQRIPIDAYLIKEWVDLEKPNRK